MSGKKKGKKGGGSKRKKKASNPTLNSVPPAFTQPPAPENLAQLMTSAEAKRDHIALDLRLVTWRHGNFTAVFRTHMTLRSVQRVLRERHGLMRTVLFFHDPPHTDNRIAEHLYDMPLSELFADVIRHATPSFTANASISKAAHASSAAAGSDDAKSLAAETGSALAASIASTAHLPTAVVFYDFDAHTKDRGLLKEPAQISLASTLSISPNVSLSAPNNRASLLPIPAYRAQTLSSAVSAVASASAPIKAGRAVTMTPTSDRARSPSPGGSADFIAQSLERVRNYVSGRH